MGVDSALVEAIIDFIERRFPGDGQDGAAGMYTSSGRMLISTAPEALNDGVSLCHETGCLCDAYGSNENITASACLVREAPGRFIFLSPCGVCQERLFLYGSDVSVAVPVDEDPTQWQARSLSELQPFYWRKALGRRPA